MKDALATILKNSSLSKAILLSLICVSMLPIIVVFLVVMNESNVALREQMIENLRVLTHTQAKEWDQRLAQIQEATAGIAPLLSEALSNEAPPEALGDLLTAAQVSNPAVQHIYLIQPDGTVLAAPQDRRLPTTAHIQADGNPPTGSQWVVHHPAGVAADGWLLTLVTPLEAGGGELLAVLAEDIDIHNLIASDLPTTLLGATATPTTPAVARNFFITPQGDILAGQSDTETADLLASVPQGLDPAEVHEVSGPAGETYLVMVAPMTGTGWHTSLIISPELIVPPASPSLRVRALTLMVAVVIFVAIMAAFLTRMIHQPLKLLMVGVEELSNEGRAKQITVDSFRELNHLAQAFNEMAGKIWERESALKAKVARLRIEIDQVAKKQQVDSLARTDFFKELEINAARLREELKRE